MQKITAVPNKMRTGFSFPSAYNRSTLIEWLKKYKTFEISPVINESREVRGYLEGGIVPAYCEWQYGINARERGKAEQRRFLFKRDFNYEIVNDREGTPVRSPISSKGLAASISNTYTQWASENGAPIPNPELYKMWKNKYSLDERFPSFFEFLDFLELECDAMPSSATLEKLKTEEKPFEYPEEDIDPEKIPF